MYTELKRRNIYLFLLPWNKKENKIGEFVCFTGARKQGRQANETNFSELYGLTLKFNKFHGFNCLQQSRAIQTICTWAIHMITWLVLDWPCPSEPFNSSGSRKFDFRVNNPETLNLLASPALKDIRNKMKGTKKNYIMYKRYVCFSWKIFLHFLYLFSPNEFHFYIFLFYFIFFLMFILRTFSLMISFWIRHKIITYFFPLIRRR